jgi:uncharacterized protein YlxP (DUF503 family)
VIGWGSCEILIPMSHSLKEKRQVLQRLIALMRRQFNLSIAETEGQETWQRSRLEIALVGTSETIVREAFQSIHRFLESNLEITVLSLETQVM